MTSLADKIAPDNIKKLIPYQSARRIGGSGRLWLNANELEQPLHFSDQQNAYHRYPDFLPRTSLTLIRITATPNSPFWQ